MKHGAPNILIFLIILLLSVSFIGILTGIVGDSWWKKNTSIKLLGIEMIEEGLWRTCTVYSTDKDNKCENRENIFRFKNDGSYKDGIILILATAIIFVIFAVISLSFLFCCHGNAIVYKRRSLFACILSFLGMAAGFTALVLAEVTFSDEWNMYDHGWSVTSAWIGTICSMVAFLLCAVLTSILSSKQNRLVIQVVERERPVSECVNQGFEMQADAERK